MAAVPLVLALAGAAGAYPPLTVAPILTGECKTYDVHGLKIISPVVAEKADPHEWAFHFRALNNSGFPLTVITADVDLYVDGKYSGRTMARAEREDGSPQDYGHVYAQGETLYMHGLVMGLADGQKPDLQVRDVFSVAHEGKCE
ncbi:MAG TPA: hypothetical protein VHM88_21695 [Candidatus Acidoferrales bacterium]|nr:hypothetical protein [Candidatus Acidoferrales bacterium]